MRWFWESVRGELGLDDQKRLLEFATGSSRAPVGGLGAVRLTIQRDGGDTDRLPTARTVGDRIGGGVV